MRRKRVRMKTLAAGPDGVLQAGQVVDLPSQQAKAFLDGGYAEEFVESKVERATKEPKEKATASAQSESKGSKPKEPAEPEAPAEPESAAEAKEEPKE
jgi:hypothetical protein